MGRFRVRVTATIGIAVAAVAIGAAPGWAGTRTEPGDEASAAAAVVVRAAQADDLGAEAAARVAAMTVREQAASVVMGHVSTTDAATLADYMTQTGIGGFILMGENIPSDETGLRALTAALTPDAAFPPLIAVDQEGGDVSRLGWDALPAAGTLKNEPPAATQDAFAGRGALVQRSGIGVNFGIVADVTDDPSSFIYGRALGTTPQGGADRVSAAVAGEGDQVLSTLKHFPGHGAAAGDSHTVIPATGMTQQEWVVSAAVPFQAGIDAGAPLLMFGHLAYTAVDPAPASLSAVWHRIAREDLGFEGVSITDDLGMLEASGDPAYADPVANAVSAIAAGNDMVLAVIYTTAETAPRMVDGIVAAVESGAIPGDRLEEAATRVAALRLALAAGGRGLMPCAACAPVG
ncbi:glycoside hydrolase family 3 N-terminal domain-containing protein [Microbacterium sp. BWT-B31]|uniref:glycoside hydrolase family 3 N-terminal domain-containing protein n=1 Tax=Microbacterium sp. BWT-B31 TaxID=3232072 RepID=UPI003527FEBD